MQNTVPLHDYMVEGPRMGRDELFIRIPRAKPRRNREAAPASGKPGGVRQRRNKRWSW